MLDKARSNLIFLRPSRSAAVRHLGFERFSFLILIPIPLRSLRRAAEGERLRGEGAAAWDGQPPYPDGQAGWPLFYYTHPINIPD